MLNEVHREFKRYSKHCRSLKHIIDDTQSSLEEIHSSLQTVCDLKSTFQNTITNLKQKLERAPTFLIFGQNCHGKALFVNALLEQNILPLNSSNWRYVTFIYGYTKNIRLILGNDIEIVEGLQAHKIKWTTIPEQDIRRNENESVLNHCPSLEIELCTPLLKDNISIAVPPDCNATQLCDFLTKQHSNILPIIVYCINENILNDANIQEIHGLKGIFKVPFLFLKINAEKTFSSEHTVICSETNRGESSKISNLADQLMRLGFMSDNENTRTEITNKRNSLCLGCSLDTLTCDEKSKEDFLKHIRNVLKYTVLKLARKLSEIHNTSLRKFILSAFDMARELQITPKRLDYAKKIELQLYETLLSIACEQQEEIAAMIQKTLADMRTNVAEVLEGYNRNNIRRLVTPKVATIEIQQLILHKINESVAAQLVQSVGCLHESFTGTLQRCLESLEKSCHVLEGGLSASNAVKQIVTAAYNIDLTSPSSFSITHNLMDKLKMLLTSFILPWASTNQIHFNFQWQLQIASNMIERLNASKLAKTICLQFKEIIRTSHESFLSAMRSLDHQLSDQLEHTEEQRITIRKRHAPHFARLALESTSLSDYVKHGMPKQIKEIGRGQYGVVSSCEPWANINPCAYKSVVPPDDRHWNDLAMEFFYTRTIPEHPRIVKFRGSVIDHSYGGGSLPAVLLVMERMSRDLYCGLRSGLAWQIRLRIAIDVIEGIRYLHSQGLVHRDIKLKNVLLDNDNRAKLTDFGFCIPEAMMSGSIVGTPVHMAPELLSGRYDSKVDVYAFGILFWYICSGQVKIPMHFDQFQNKEQLWESVRKGMRPECLPNFDIKCWNLMEQCWASDPAERPLLGYVQPRLEHMYNKVAQETQPKAPDVSI